MRLTQLAGRTGDPRRRATARHGARVKAGPGRLAEWWAPPGAAVAGPPRRRRLAFIGGFVAVAVAGVLVAVLFENRPEPERAPSLPAARAVSTTGVTGTGGGFGDGAGTDPSSRAGSGGRTDPAGNGAGTESSAPGSAPGAGPTSPLVVSVVGKVAEPGLVTVAPGARVAEAIEHAGGAEPGADLHTVNLARTLSDGEQIYVGVPMPPGVRSARGSPGSRTGDVGTAPVKLNVADRKRLESLPGVGEVTARRILDWRAQHGRFTAVEQLREVDGIGRKRFAELRERVSLG